MRSVRSTVLPPPPVPPGSFTSPSDRLKYGREARSQLTLSLSAESLFRNACL